MKKQDYFYVGSQFALFFAFILVSNRQYNDPQWLKYIGAILSGIGLLVLILSLIQLNKNLSPFPTPKSNSSLVTNGLYAIVRHPIYLGILLTCLGYSFFQESFHKLVITFLLTILFHFKSSYEEKMLLSRYPDYHAYQKCTGKIIPFI